MGSVQGAFSADVDRMLQMAEQAVRQGAELVVFPATVLSGAYPLALGERRAYVLDLLEAIRDFASRTPVTAVVPAYLSDGVAGYLEVFLCGEGEACPLRRREVNRVNAEHEVAAEATASCTLDGVSVQFLTGDTSVAPNELSCDVAVALTPLPYCFDDSSSLGVTGLAGSVLLPLIEESSCSVALVQGVGAYDDVVLAGGSFATDENSVVVAAAPLFEESLAVFEVAAPGEAEQDGVRGVFDGLPTSFSPYVGLPASAVPTPTYDDSLGYLYRALTVAVRDYVRKAGFSDALVGLSGGIDSSLVASLAVDALGPEHVMGVLMPGPYSSGHSVDDALDLASRLEMRTRTVPITGLYEVACPLLADALGAPFEGIARENIQARLRGTVLMAVSNATGALVLNTGNKSESAMGYSTLYGDTVGAYAPLSDVYKTRVYELARWRNARGPHAVIPRHVLDKPPSAELSEGQTDEGSLGAAYAQIDQILNLHVERGLDAQDIVDAGFDPTLVNRVLRACVTAEYKRRQEPMGPVVSLAPFVDRGWPVVMGWQDRAQGPAPARRNGEGAARCCGCTLDAEEVADAAEAEMPERIEVDEVLDAMLAHAARQEQVMGMVGDVVFGAFVSGRGSDMDDCLGMPLFSKN